jgi:transcriptional regulator with XRE-family HTH domain
MTESKRPGRDRKLARRFGERLQQLRRGAGLSQLELSLATGVSTPFVSGLERGVRQPSLQSRLKLSGGLGVTLEDLVRGLGGKRAPNDDEVPRVLQLTRGMTRAEAQQTVDVVEALARKGARKK